MFKPHHFIEPDSAIRTTFNNAHHIGHVNAVVDFLLEYKLPEHSFIQLEIDPAINNIDDFTKVIRQAVSNMIDVPYITPVRRSLRIVTDPVLANSLVGLAPVLNTVNQQMINKILIVGSADNPFIPQVLGRIHVPGAYRSLASTNLSFDD